MLKYDFTNVKNVYIICGKKDMNKGIDGIASLIQEAVADGVAVISEVSLK